MFRLKLIQGKSYSGLVYAHEKNPIIDVDNQATADALLSSGYFQMKDGEKPGIQIDLDKLFIP